MPSKPWSHRSKIQRVIECVAAIDAIASYIADMDFNAFKPDRKTVSAVEREIMIVAETITKLEALERDEAIAEDQRLAHLYPNLHEIRGMANRLRHAYDLVDQSVLWNTITGPDLPALKDALKRY